MSKLCSNYFSSNGTWTCPAGVTKVYVLAHGGGAGGSGGRNTTAGVSDPGTGTVPQLVALTVVPNTSYSIIIGTGGTGGAPRTSSTQNGSAGNNTLFGALYTFRGAVLPSSTYSFSNPFPGLVLAAANRVASTNGEFKTSGMVSNSGTSGTRSGSYLEGYRGADGYFGSVAGSGGNSNNAGTGANGTNASGFGAGGGSGGGGSTAGGSGGNGAPGQLWVIWVE